MIEYIVGKETHTSNWGKFYVKGLEKWEVEEDHDSAASDKHHFYKFYMAEAPVGTIFTIFEQSGDKRGTDVWYFIVCEVATSADSSNRADYGKGFVSGNYRRIAEASGKIKAPRLMDWWTKMPAGVDKLRYAEHCAEWIEKRGVKDLPMMEGV